VVVVARAVRHRAVDVVRTADDEGLHQAVDHLVAIGHRRIAHIDGGRAPGAADRRRGYRQAMRRHGLDAMTRILPGGLTEDDGAAAAARALLDTPRASGPPPSPCSTIAAPPASSTFCTASASPCPATSA
jgi:DNA-binding LacI/PurR family transcriptional regulator